VYLPYRTGDQVEFHNSGLKIVHGFLGGKQLRELAAEAGRAVHRSAMNIRKPLSGGMLHYRVVTGEYLCCLAPRLHQLYKSSLLLHWVRRMAGCNEVSRSPHRASSININALFQGEGYPRHLDAVPYTAILFLTSMPAEGGGELVVEQSDDRLIEIRPAAGDLVLMDGSRCFHHVNPVKVQLARLSVPMVYPAKSVPRPAGLDRFLYEPAA
jgi:hypothetical protein